MTYKSLRDYCNELIAQGDDWGQELLDSFGQTRGEQVYENEHGILQDPSDFSYASGQRIEWTCSKGHHWKTTINHRTLVKRGCAFCNGTKTILEGENDLFSQQPDLMKEWDWEENEKEGLNPKQLRTKSDKKVNWICSKGHKWVTTIQSRTIYNSGCPICSTNSTSYPEQFIYWSFKQIFPNTQNRVKLFKSEENPQGKEIDIFIPELKLCIEYGAEKWHKGKEANDNVKKQLALQNNLKFIEIKELTKCELKLATELVETKAGDRESLTKIVQYIFNQYNLDFSQINIEQIKNQATEYSKGKIEYEKSLEYLFPDIAAEFDIERNNELLPSEITPGSRMKAYWQCKKNIEHIWKATISDRTSKKSGCPICCNNNFHKKEYRITLGQFSF